MKGPNGDGTVHAVRTQARFAFASNGEAKIENGERLDVQLNSVVPPADRYARLHSTVHTLFPVRT